MLKTIMNALAGIVALALVAGCTAISPADYATPEEYQAAVDERAERLDRAGRYAEAFRLVAINQIEIWNAAGIDPLQWDETKLLKASALCGTATAIATVINPEMAELSSEGTQWCGFVIKALAPASAPATAPLPVPAPNEA
jgi:hypothetical protein